MDTVLSVKNLTVTILTEKKKIVDDVSFDIKAGEVVVLSGANGCGKSTIIRTIMQDKGTDGNAFKELSIGGSIFFEDSENILHYTPEQLQEKLQKRVGYVRQKDEYECLPKKITVAECLSVSAENFITPKKLSMNEINNILLTYAPRRETKEKIQFQAKNKVSRLSGGQQRLLTIISYVVVRENASLFLIDEPLNNLDTENMINVSNLISLIHRNHPQAAFLIVTHCHIFPFVTRRIKMVNGRVELDSTDYAHYDCLETPIVDGFYKIPE